MSGPKLTAAQTETHPYLGDFQSHAQDSTDEYCTSWWAPGQMECGCGKPRPPQGRRTLAQIDAERGQG